MAPSSNGGSAITGYTVTSSPGGITATGATSPINVTGLTIGTAYTFAVIATNAVGNSVASAASTAVTPAAPFVCCTSTITDVDNNIYNTVLIGSQCWTTTNLKVMKYNNNNDPIPDETNSTSNPWAPTSGARTGYVAADVTDYVGTFGYLYNWYAVNDSRKLCPSGWHVPTDAEWTIMIQALDPSQFVISGNVLIFTGGQSLTAGTALKSAVTNTTAGSGLGWNPAFPTPSHGTNTSGFSGLPGGFRNIDGSFFNISYFAVFWSATENDDSSAWYRYLNYSSGSVDRGNGFKSFGASVRCLRD